LLDSAESFRREDNLDYAAANPSLNPESTAKPSYTKDTATFGSLFQDDFSGDLSQWDVITGIWTIENGELSGIGQGGRIDAWIYAGDFTWTNYAFSAWIDFDTGNGILVARSTGHWENEYRIEFWSQTLFLRK
jgi:hypothetical protein